LKLNKLAKRQILRDEVRDHLLDAIVRGELKPGERIIETRVAEMLGVSQAPVREAMRDLELMGFIESEPHRGATVCRPSQDEILTVYPVRATLEGVAGRLAVSRMTEEDFQQLEIELANMEDAARRNDRHAHSTANIAFHHIIIAASGNRTLLRLWEMMRLHNWTFVTAALSGQELASLAARHRILIEAMRSGDPDRAEEAMRQHIDEAAKWLTASFERQKE
jgi:DNA-binding GntR family transcriptional regulator